MRWKVLILRRQIWQIFSRKLESIRVFFRTCLCLFVNKIDWKMYYATCKHKSNFENLFKVALFLGQCWDRYYHRQASGWLKINYDSGKMGKLKKSRSYLNIDEVLGSFSRGIINFKASNTRKADTSNLLKWWIKKICLFILELATFFKL